MRADAEEAAAAAAEAEEAAEVAVALAQLQGLPHPDAAADEAGGLAGSGGGGGGGASADDGEEESSDTPMLVGSCALPSEQVRLWARRCPLRGAFLPPTRSVPCAFPAPFPRAPGVDDSTHLSIHRHILRGDALHQCLDF